MSKKKKFLLIKGIICLFCTSLSVIFLSLLRKDFDAYLSLAIAAIISSIGGAIYSSIFFYKAGSTN